MKWKIIFNDVASSSMELAVDLPSSCLEGIVCVAKRQLCGRGRNGRAWVSPEGGLYCSIFFNPDWSVRDISKITLLTAVAVCEAVHDVSGIQAEIKWPNDLLVNGKKIAGILTESQISGQKVEYVAIGIGINANTKIEKLPEGAVSLTYLTGKSYDLKQVLDAVLKKIDFWHKDVSENGFWGMFSQWRAFCGMLGRRVRVIQESGALEGVALDITDDGALLIEKDGGSKVSVMSGDILQVRQC